MGKVNDYVKKRFGRYMDQCTKEEIYVALLEYVKERAAEAYVPAKKQEKRKYNYVLLN